MNTQTKLLVMMLYIRQQSVIPVTNNETSSHGLLTFRLLPEFPFKGKGAVTRRNCFLLTDLMFISTLLLNNK